jgi:hypothetical protein
MVDRVVLGQRSNGNYGLFVSPPGVNAYTAADDALGFSTQWGHAAAIHAEGLIALNGVNWSSWVTFPTLPYVPHVLAGWYESATGYYYYAQAETFSAGGTWGGVTTNFFGPYVEVQAGQLRVSQAQDKGAGWYIKYFVLRQPGGS